MMDNQQSPDTSTQPADSTNATIDVINPWGKRRPFQLKKPIQQALDLAPDPIPLANNQIEINNDAQDNLTQLSNMLGNYQTELHIQNLILGGTISGSILGGQANAIHALSTGRVSSYTAPSATSLDKNTSLSDIFESPDKVEEWFFDHLHGKEVYQAFVLTVAIFAGNSDRFIHQATEALVEKLFPEHGETSIIPITNTPFSRRVKLMMKTTFSGKGHIQITMESGKTDLETIDFIDPKIRPAIIRLLCESPDMKSIHNQIVEWLTDWINASDQKLRDAGTPLSSLTQVQAAMMLGNFGKFDYTYYLTAIIRPWAKSNNWTNRFMVGWVLLGLMLDYGEENQIEEADKKVYHQQTVSLIKHWSTTDNPNYQWTAATALSRIGLLVPIGTFPLFKNLMLSPYKDTQWATQVSLHLLYGSGDLYAKKIILELASWLEDNEQPELADKATISFMQVLDNQFQQMDANEPINSQYQTWTNNVNISISSARITVWQLIGDELSGESERLTTAIVNLFSYALQHRNAKLVDKVMEKIMWWLDKLNDSDQPKVQDAFVLVIGRLAQKPQLKRYIDYIINQPQFNGYSLVYRIKQFN